MIVLQDFTQTVKVQLMLYGINKTVFKTHYKIKQTYEKSLCKVKRILAAELSEQKRRAFPGNNAPNMNILDLRLTF